MCGRVNVSDFPPLQRLMEYLGMPIYPSRPQRYNITPGSNLDVLNNNKFSFMEWSIGFNRFKHPNTRIETIGKKRNLQNILLSQRCIIPINRYYEWPNIIRKEKYGKTRYCIHTSEGVMLLGGIYIKRGKNKQFNILTTKSNKQISEFHHRMPVIIRPEDFKSWMSSTDLNTMYELSSSYDGELIIYECSEYVDNGRNEGAKCIDPIEEHQLKLF